MSSVRLYLRQTLDGVGRDPFLLVAPAFDSPGFLCTFQVRVGPMPHLPNVAVACPAALATSAVMTVWSDKHA